MPFQPINFAAIQPDGSPVLRDFVNNLVKGYQAGQMPYEMQRKAEQEQLANAFQQMKNQQEPQRFQTEQQNAESQRAYQEANTNRVNTMTPVEALQQTLINKYYPQLTQSQINEKNAQTNKTNTMIPLDAKYQDLINTFYPREKEAEIAQKGAMTKYYNQGGPGQGVGGKEWNHFQNSIAQANPKLSQDQLQDAINAYGFGRTTLADGTPFNISADMKNSRDRVFKYGTTAAALNRNIFGEQAENEIPVVSKYIEEGFKPYDNSLMKGYAFDFEKDKFDVNNPAAQERVGKRMAANALTFEKSQIQQMLASGKTTAQATREIENLTTGFLKSMNIVVSPKALEVMRNTMDSAFKDMYKARKNVDIGAASAGLNKNNTEKSSNSSLKPPKKVTFEELEKL